VSWDQDKKRKIAAKYQVALRIGKELVPVGWASSVLSENDQLRQSHGLISLLINEHESGGDVNVQIVLASFLLNLRIR
jgi:hypothetical protein